ncbi:MAG: ankyrin repeat domain-containing protein [Bryobacterales bacterium]|nr:ankyrin repeat domain-containing protein [Bryobacterales bacterium]
MNWAGHDFGAIQKDSNGRHRVKQPRAVLLLLWLAVLAFWIGLRLLGQAPDGSVSLHEALERRQYTQAIEILRLGVDPNEPGVGGKLPIVIAARDASADAYDVVYELLRLGADPNSHSGDGSTALHMAAMAGNLGVVDLLIRHGADVNATENGAVPPVHSAYIQGHFRVARYLESFGAVAPRGDELEMLEYAGRMRNRVDALLELPKPEHYSQEEWLRKGVMEALLEEGRSWVAAPGMEALLKAADEIYLRPRPEGVSAEQWYHQTRALLEQKLASGEFESQLKAILEFQSRQDNQ